MMFCIQPLLNPIIWVKLFLEKTRELWDYNSIGKVAAHSYKTVTRNYVLKEEFKHDDIYKSGYVFVNKRLLKSSNEVVPELCHSCTVSAHLLLKSN